MCVCVCVCVCVSKGVSKIWNVNSVIAICYEMLDTRIIK